MTKVIQFPRHHRRACRPTCAGCALCLGGLFICSVCRGAESELTSDCCGFRLDASVLELVRKGEVDYRRSQGWVYLAKRVQGSEA